MEYCIKTMQDVERLSHILRPPSRNDGLAPLKTGEAFEAVNLHTHLFRSVDQGETWRHVGPLYGGTPQRLTSDCARLTALPDGGLAVFMIRHDRTGHSEDGLTNPETLGFVRPIIPEVVNKFQDCGDPVIFDC